jgi:hypothetical protein
MLRDDSFKLRSFVAWKMMGRSWITELCAWMSQVARDSNSPRMRITFVLMMLLFSVIYKFNIVVSDFFVFSAHVLYYTLLYVSLNLFHFSNSMLNLNILNVFIFFMNLKSQFKITCLYFTLIPQSLILYKLLLIYCLFGYIFLRKSWSSTPVYGTHSVCCF